MIEKSKKFKDRNIKKYSTELRDDRSIYNELNNLYNYAVEDKANHLSKTFVLLEEQLNKYPQSISSQIHLLSHIALESFKKYQTNKELVLLKKSLAFILEISLACEKKHCDENTSKRIIYLLSPYLEYISIFSKNYGLNMIYSRLIKVLAFLNEINEKEFINLVKMNYSTFATLIDIFPGPWVQHLLHKFNFKFKNKLNSNGGMFKDIFEDSVLNCLYEPSMGNFNVKLYKLKDSYLVYQKMLPFRVLLKDEVKKLIT